MKVGAHEQQCTYHEARWYEDRHAVSPSARIVCFGHILALSHNVSLWPIADTGYRSALNWLYVVIHADDLARGAFEHAVVTGANA